MAALRELLAGYARGETDTQHAVLDEVEPLLFGMVRSLGADHDRAVALANALTLSFHLRAGAGALDLETANDLRRYCHEAAVRKLRDPEPVRLKPLADPETGSMVYTCYGVGLTLETELTPGEIDAFAARLAGAPPDPTWPALAQKLSRCGVL